MPALRFWKEEMAMDLRKCILVNNDCYKAGKTIVPKGVFWHSTGANNPYLMRYVQPDDGALGDNRYNNDWNRGGLDVCVHAFIGKLANGEVATYQTLPWNRRGWHAGSGRNGSANNTHISFEVCEDGLTDEVYFREVYRKAVELTAMLCKEYNLDPLADGVIIDHKEGSDRGIASNHGDITHWLKRYGMTMDDARWDVHRYMTTGMLPGEMEENEMRYYTLGDLKKDKTANTYYLPTIEKLMRNGVLKGKGGTGDDTIIDLGEDAVRLLVIFDRQGLFGA